MAFDILSRQNEFTYGKTKSINSLRKTNERKLKWAKKAREKEKSTLNDFGPGSLEDSNQFLISQRFSKCCAVQKQCKKQCN